MVHYPDDYKWGTEAEQEILQDLEKYFRNELNQYPQKAKHDFWDDNNNYEIKSRTNSFSRYPTTMITANKVSGDKPIMFIFNFTDRICGIKYDAEKFAGYEKKDFSRANQKWDEKPTFFIPIADLFLIKIKPAKCLLKLPTPLAI
jgi:hypothetical protein